MKKLELKHLAGYLPYGLKGISIEENLGFEIVKGYSIYGKNDTVCLTTNVDDIDLELFKPILRPLSDLTKEIEVNGEKFVPRDTEALCKYEICVNPNFDFFDGMGSNEDVDDLPYCVIQKLYEWHFDIHGLIEKGLAIDINTL